VYVNDYNMLADKCINETWGRIQFSFCAQRKIRRLSILGFASSNSSVVVLCRSFIRYDCL